MREVVSAELLIAAYGHSRASCGLGGTALASEVRNNPNYSGFPQVESYRSRDVALSRCADMCCAISS